MDTLLLDRSSWDLVLDANGNIARASAPYALAQDAASAIRTFLGECYYDTAKGVPYFEQILGHFPSVSFMVSQFEAAALTVPGVVTARCYLDAIQDRVLTGQVQITDATGATTAAGF
jgi:hypothetical protein